MRLQLGDTEVVIETPFVLRRGDEQFSLDPADRGALGTLLNIYPAALATAAVRPDLTLELTFEDRVSIEVPQHPLYEAWQLVGPSPRLIVCPPQGDGGLALWL